LNQAEAKLVLDYLTSPSARGQVEKATLLIGMPNLVVCSKQTFLRGLAEALAQLPKLEYLKLAVFLHGETDCDLTVLKALLTNNTLTSLHLCIDVRLAWRALSFPARCRTHASTKVPKGRPSLGRGSLVQSVPQVPRVADS
jgi:hypothetical protein